MNPPKLQRNYCQCLRSELQPSEVAVLAATVCRFRFVIPKVPSTVTGETTNKGRATGVRPNTRSKCALLCFSFHVRSDKCQFAALWQKSGLLCQSSKGTSVTLPSVKFDDGLRSPPEHLSKGAIKGVIRILLSSCCTPRPNGLSLIKLLAESKRT